MSSGPSRTGVGSLLGVLTLMALLRAVALALPTMHLRGLNAARFLPPWLRWTPLVISVATLHPAIGRLCLPGFEWLSRGRSLVLSILAVTLGLLIGFPDRVWFVGDYLLRMGIVSEAHGFETMFPQALPLDAIRHFWLPRTLGAWLHVAPTTIERALGVIEGAWLAVLACRFAKRMNAGPAATTAVALVVLFGGYFTLFTGYGKPTIEVCLFTAAAGAFGLELVRDNRSAIPFGLAVAAALAFHRSGWSILPGAALAWILWYRAHGRLGAWKSVPHAIGFAIPLATVAVLLPRVLRLVLGFDVATNFASAEVRRQGGVLTVAFSSQRLLDVANVILLLSPLALAAVGWLSSVRREPARRNEAWLLLGLALSFVPSLLFVYVTQGPFRDWDAFAGAGVATSLLVGWILCETLRDCERMSWLAVPAALAVITPTLAQLLVHNLPEAGMRRTRAFLDEPPVRTQAYRIATLDLIGLRSMRLHQWTDAAEAYREVVAAAPSPRALEFWGVSSALAGNHRDAEQAFQQLTARDSSNAMGWVGLWMSATLLGDTLEAGRARAIVATYAPDGPEDRAIQERVSRLPELGVLLQAATVRDRERLRAR